MAPVSLFELLTNDPPGLTMCPVIVARPGVSGSRQCIQVVHGMPIAHVLDGGFVFPKITWRVDIFNAPTIITDDGIGAVAGTWLPGGGEVK